MLFRFGLWFFLSFFPGDALSASKCSPIYLGKPELPGATVLDIQASEAHNHTSVGMGPGTDDQGWYTTSFCNVTILYTHPGWNDRVQVQVWLPLDNWNGRFQALGGAGYNTGMGSLYLSYAVAHGYSAAATDGGHAGQSGAIPTDLTWALSSKHNVNWFLLENYGSKATNDMAEIGKHITGSFYGQSPRYSYFNGCSGGGRQGLMMAQRFPGTFDGILASSPAINPQTFIPAGFWPTHVMRQVGSYPSPCEVRAFVKAAIDACDGLDGVEDGIISLPEICNVTAFDFVGQKYLCNGTQQTLSSSGAEVVQAAWSGSGNDGSYGLNKDAALASYYIATACYANNTCFIPNSGTSLFSTWISYLVAKDVDFDFDEMSDKDFFDVIRKSQGEYESMLATNNPDLSRFHAYGGKMITWHGLADEVIPPNGTIAYYEEVLNANERVRDFYRFFAAPGVGHCFGGVGPIPNGAFSQLVDWVERGIAPNTLHAIKGRKGMSRKLCPYPLRQKFLGGDPWSATSFTCTAV